jgi:hypothetical protein
MHGRRRSGRRVSKIDRGCFAHLLLSDVDVCKLGSEKRETEFQAPAGPGDV